MPWITPTLEEVRQQARDSVQAKLRSGPLIPNSGLRVMVDTNADVGFLTLLYLDWLARQLLPDTAEKEWLDRHAAIWLTEGRKAATYAVAVASATGTGTIPAGAQLRSDDGTWLFSVNSQVIVSGSPTNVNLTALTPGATGLVASSIISFTVGIAGIDGSVTITSITDGVDEETDDELRVRVLDRIREPPMGGDAEDYVQWALEVPGVTRAWSAPNEMGIGTVTVRFMMDDLRATGNPSTNGFPLAGDITAVQAHLDQKRPVCVKDFFVVAPIPDPINFTLQGLFPGDVATQNAIVASVTEMLREKAAPSHARNGVLQPANTIYAAWVSDAVLSAQGVEYFDLVMSDHLPASNGSLAVMGTITYTG